MMTFPAEDSNKVLAVGVPKSNNDDEHSNEGDGDTRSPRRGGIDVNNMNFAISVINGDDAIVRQRIRKVQGK